jgi:ribosomal protein L11 methyltransferase
MTKSISTVKLQVSVDHINAELHYFINQLPFIGVEEKKASWLWYWEVKVWDTHEEDIRQFFEYRNIPFTYERVDGKNWNASWEASFSPVSIGSFCNIRAQFHALRADVMHDIVIDPKMAFGTGHHDTTYQMVQAMETYIAPGSQVIDLGTGTGILAILAEKMGAAHVLAIDNDPAAIENTKENLVLNHCDRIKVQWGDVSDVENELAAFDLILANINRNVLLDVAEKLSNQASQGTELIMSGVLKTDASQVMKAYEAAWSPQLISQSEDWVCIYGKKT